MTLVLRCRIPVLGEAKVGKTALIQMLNSEGAQYPKMYTMTIGAEVVVKKMHLSESETFVELFLVDVGGKIMFKDLQPKYIENATMGVFVYDIASKETFEAIPKWIELYKQLNHGKLKGVLIANRTDLEERLEVKSTLGRQFAKENGLEFFETSALQGNNVQEPFLWLASHLHSAYEQQLRQFSELRS